MSVGGKPPPTALTKSRRGGDRPWSHWVVSSPTQLAYLGSPPVETWEVESGPSKRFLGTNFKHFYIKKIVDRILGDFYFLFYISGVCFVP